MGLFSSLRTRLWLSYALLIWVLLTIVALVLLVLFLQNPRIAYPEINYQLRMAAGQMADGAAQVRAQSAEALQTYLRRQAKTSGFHLAVIERNRDVVATAGEGKDPPVGRMLLAIQRNAVEADQVRVIRETDGSVWLYAWHAMGERERLLVSVQPPMVLLRTVLRNEVFISFVYAGLFAMLLSFLLALWLGGWIAEPLRKMAAAFQRVASGVLPVVQVSGPQEVQELAKTLNNMNQKVQSSQLSQREFVANVSHELKTPLTSIQGFAQAILDGAVSTPEELQLSARVIYDESGRMHRLVLDLLSLARLEAGTADLQQQPVNLELLLRNVVDTLAPQAQKAQVTLVAEVEAVPTIIGDGDRLAQVFTNLVDNALKFTPVNGKVTVANRLDGNTVVARVSDTGQGISPEDKERIFERFYQVDRSRRGGAGRGVGLGLAIAQQIVLAHGGKIWVESQPGQGSVFVVKIPLSKSDDSTQMKRLSGK